MLFFMFINVKMPTIVGSLTLMSRKTFMLNSVKHEKSFITSGPDFFVLSNLQVLKILFIFQFRFSVGLAASYQV